MNLFAGADIMFSLALERFALEGQLPTTRCCTNWMSTVGENINEVERFAAEKAEMKYAVGLYCCSSFGSKARR